MTRRGPFTAARSTVRLSKTRKEASGRVPVSCGSSPRGTHTRDHALMAHPCEGAWPWCHLFAAPEVLQVAVGERRVDQEGFPYPWLSKEYC